MENKLSVRLNTAIKRIFRIFGLEVSRFKAERRTKLAQTLHHISFDCKFSPQSVVDVGVAYGTPELYESFPKARHFLIEPLEEFKPLIDNILNNYNAEYIKAAAGSHSGEITINISSQITGSSIFNGKHDQPDEMLKRVVPIVTLDEIYATKNPAGPFLIKIDAEGAEMQVMDGALNLLQETEVVILEVSLLTKLKDAPEFNQIIEYMNAKKFVPFDIVVGRYRTTNNALAQVDIVFVRESGEIRKICGY